MNSTGQPTSSRKKWIDKYRVAIKGLADERRARLRRDHRHVDRPAAHRFLRPRVRAEETKGGDGNRCQPGQAT